MTPTSSLLTCSDRYCEMRRIARSTLSGQIFKDSRSLDRVAAGGSVTMRNFERALLWFSSNWPEDEAWPAGVDRPAAQHPTPKPTPLPAEVGL